MNEESVIRIARTGHDARRDADYHMLFDSRWLSLKVCMQGDTLINDIGASGSLLVATHKLGYYPAFMAFVNDGSGSRMIDFNYGSLEVDKHDMRWYFQGKNLGLINLTYYIFLVDLEEDIDQTDIKMKVGAETAKEDQNRLEFTKIAYDVKGARPQDFIASTRYPSHIIHKLSHGTKAAGYSTISVPHELDYQPMYFAYGKGAGVGTSGGYRTMDHDTGVTGTENVVISDLTNVSITNGYPFDYSILILKDPI